MRRPRQTNSKEGTVIYSAMGFKEVALWPGHALLVMNKAAERFRSLTTIPVSHDTADDSTFLMSLTKPS
jgi:hypothetical protein